MENKFLRQELGKLIGGEANVKIPSVEELESILGVPHMKGVPGSNTGGMENAADTAFPSIDRRNAGVANSFD